MTITVKVKFHDVENLELIEEIQKHGVLMTPKDMKELLDEPLHETIGHYRVICGIEVIFKRIRLPIYA